MRKKAFFNIFWVLFLYVTTARSTPLPAKPNAPYTLKTISAASSNDGYDVVRLFNSKTQKIIWTRKFKYDSSRVTAWSKDGRALAIYLRWDTILVWRLGYRTRFFKAPKEEDYIMSFNWSPDNRRLLIHSGSSGTDMTPFSHIFCLNITSRRMSSIALDGASSVSWVGARKIRYSIMRYNGKKGVYYTVGKPRTFRVP